MPSRGDIYWVDFSATQGSEQGGLRPALVIQNDLGNQSSPTTIVAALTSRIKKKYPFHVDVTAKESGLDRDGTVLLEQLRTVAQARLTGLLGQLSETKMREVSRALKISLGIDRQTWSPLFPAKDSIVPLPSLASLQNLWMGHREPQLGQNLIQEGTRAQATLHSDAFPRCYRGSPRLFLAGERA